MSNPYHVGQPVTGADFFGRAKELRIILEHVENRGSISLVGERRIGKTSLLLHLMEESVQRAYLAAPAQFAFIFVTGKLVRRQKVFFDILFRELQHRGLTIFTRSEGVTDDPVLLEGYLRDLRRQGKRLVILMDELEDMARQDSDFCLDFFNFLRGIAESYQVSFVTATRQCLKAACPAEVTGSPFFNLFLERRLGSWSPAEFEHFLAETSRRSGVALDSHREQIQDLGGRYPFFVQLACWLCFEAGGQFDPRRIRKDFATRARDHFEYIWDHLEAEEREAVQLLARGTQPASTSVMDNLVEKGYVIDGRLFSSAFGEYVRELSKGVRIDEEAQRVRIDGVRVEVTPTQYRLLFYLYKNAGRPCSKDELAEVGWPQYKGGVSDAIVEKEIQELRDKGARRYIKTRHGFGYVLVNE